MGAILLVGGIKGGTGKTTTALNLAIVAAHRGLDTLIVDADAQASLNTWANLRISSEVEPSVTTVQRRGEGLAYELRKMSAKFDLTVVDSGGYDAPELRNGLLAADRWIVPTQASGFDVWTFAHLGKMLMEANGLRPMVHMPPLDAEVFLSRVHPASAENERKKLEQLLADSGEGARQRGMQFKLLGTVVSERVAVRDAIFDGKGVIETEGNGTAAVEIRRLFDEVIAPLAGLPEEPGRDATVVPLNNEVARGGDGR